MTSNALFNRRALVTGSVQGIGLAMACELARAGARVVLHGLPDDAAHAAARARIEALSEHPVVSLTHNLADPAEVVRMMETVLATGALDILVNNAGIQHTAALHDMPRARTTSPVRSFPSTAAGPRSRRQRAQRSAM